MKKNFFSWVTGTLLLGMTVPVFAQEVLPEVTVTAANYKYLKIAGGKDVAQPVQLLQRTAAAYDIKQTEFYEEEYDTYFISFYIPEGQLLAAYDSSGRLIRTAEKYKNVKLPTAVTSAVAARFPQWRISKDVYLVTYYETAEKSTKKYKLLLENGDKRLRVKVNEAGEFIK